MLSKSIILAQDDMIHLLLLCVCAWWCFAPMMLVDVKCNALGCVTIPFIISAMCRVHAGCVSGPWARVSAVALWCLSRAMRILVRTLSMYVNVCVKCASKWMHAQCALSSWKLCRNLSLSLSHTHKCINETWVLLLETYRLLKIFLPRCTDFTVGFTYLV